LLTRCRGEMQCAAFWAHPSRQQRRRACGLEVVVLRRLKGLKGRGEGCHVRASSGVETAGPTEALCTRTGARRCS